MSDEGNSYAQPVAGRYESIRSALWLLIDFISDVREEPWVDAELDAVLERASGRALDSLYELRRREASQIRLMHTS